MSLSVALRCWSTELDSDLPEAESSDTLRLRLEVGEALPLREREGTMTGVARLSREVLLNRSEDPGRNEVSLLLSSDRRLRLRVSSAERASERRGRMGTTCGGTGPCGTRRTVAGGATGCVGP